MPRHHLVISGVGRSGTTFLVQLFTALGQDTGFQDPFSGVLPNCNAGMELDIRQPAAPYVIKSPWLCDTLDDALETGDLVIDHALIPMRELVSAARSRIDVTRRTDRGAFPADVPGGLWHTDDPAQQEEVLARQLYKLMHTLAKRDIPTTLLLFPRLVRDEAYLWEKISFALRRVTRRRFRRAFLEISRPQLVHDFTGGTPGTS